MTCLIGGWDGGSCRFNGDGDGDCRKDRVVVIVIVAFEGGVRVASGFGFGEFAFEDWGGWGWDEGTLGFMGWMGRGLLQGFVDGFICWFRWVDGDRWKGRLQ